MYGLLDAGLINNCIYRAQLLITKIIVAITEYTHTHTHTHTHWQEPSSVVSTRIENAKFVIGERRQGWSQFLKSLQRGNFYVTREKGRKKRWRFENFSSTVRARSMPHGVTREVKSPYYSQYRARESLPPFLLIRWKISYSRGSNNNLSTSSYHCCRLAAQILSSAENIDWLFREHGESTWRW